MEITWSLDREVYRDVSSWQKNIISWHFVANGTLWNCIFCTCWKLLLGCWLSLISCITFDANVLLRRVSHILEKRFCKWSWCLMNNFAFRIWHFRLDADLIYARYVIISFRQGARNWCLQLILNRHFSCCQFCPLVTRSSLNLFV